MTPQESDKQDTSESRAANINEGNLPMLQQDAADIAFQEPDHGSSVASDEESNDACMREVRIASRFPAYEPPSNKDGENKQAADNEDKCSCKELYGMFVGSYKGYYHQILQVWGH